MQIRDVFDPSKRIDRNIEKVITYEASQESRLEAEITEYVVTESIGNQFERLLTDMQRAMEMGTESEIGVWVSGFYGSGKSSFTKYLGLALDRAAEISGTPFLKYLQDRMNRPQTRALLASVSTRFPAAVVFLDLASEMLAGATMEEVSTVLYYKVLQWAGYSRNLKVAALERRLQKDGRYNEFTDRFQRQSGQPWEDSQNDPLAVDSLIPEIAHEMYPQLFKTPEAFTTEPGDFVRFENERVQEMIDIVRQKSGKDCILFVIDEVGQYISSRPNLILNLDGLAKNIKSLGYGKVWIVCTAQQTLTEDDPRASLNSPELYKLKDRFPIEIDLESSDIREICYRRLLGKSDEGKRVLGELFDKYGPQLRSNTRLENAKYYDADFNKSTFINLYPFLPAHFDILLHLLGALAKSTGGIGLRSAIKVIQDILIDGSDGGRPVADQPVGWLATTVTLYDSLEKDIRRAAPSIHHGVQKVLIRFPDSPVLQQVAKTVAILQILGNMPVTRQNVASLIHPGADAGSLRDSVDAAVSELIVDGNVPFGEKDGNLCFFSEKVNEIDQERSQIPGRSVETRDVQNEALRGLFSPLPAVQVLNTLSVTSGLKAAFGSDLVSLAGEKEFIQTVVELVPPENYQDNRTRLVEQSRERASQSIIHLLGRTTSDIGSLALEIYRSQEIVQRHRSDPDQEVKDYCSGQIDLARRLAEDLRRSLENGLRAGSFVFRGQATAVDSLDQDLLPAAKKQLANVAGQVFDQYGEAPVRADTDLAERFLRTSIGSLQAINAQLDPLSLVQIVNGMPRVNTEHKALTSIRDYVDSNESVDGRQLVDHFGGPPFGWSPDTLRYLVAAMLVGGEVKLRVSGQEIRVNGQQAIDGLRTNNSFKSVGISLRDGAIGTDALARAAQRMMEVTGESVSPLEQQISKAAVAHFPQLQRDYGSLAPRLEHMRLPGAERVRDLNEDLAQFLETDASDLAQRLGSEESPLYTNLKWAAAVSRALNNGLEATIRELREYSDTIRDLPDAGIAGELKGRVEDALSRSSEYLGHDDFYECSADLSSSLTSIKSEVRRAVAQMIEAQRNMVRGEQQRLSSIPEWVELTHEEQSQILAQLEDLELDASQDLDGLKHLLRQEYETQSGINNLRNQIVDTGRQRQMLRLQEEKDLADREGRVGIHRALTLPTRLTTAQQLEDLIEQLQTLYSEMSLYSDIEIEIDLKD